MGLNNSKPTEVDIISNSIPNMSRSLTQEDKDGLLYIQQNEPIVVKDYAKYFNLTDKTGQRRIAKLYEKGLLEREGDNRWIKYKVKK